MALAVGGMLEKPASDPARLQQYFDDPIKIGIFWRWFGGGICDGDRAAAAALMVWPDANFGQA